VTGGLTTGTSKRKLQVTYYLSRMVCAPTAILRHHFPLDAKQESNFHATTCCAYSSEPLSCSLDMRKLSDNRQTYHTKRCTMLLPLLQGRDEMSMKHLKRLTPAV
jgi:hypothetical protein